MIRVPRFNPAHSRRYKGGAEQVLHPVTKVLQHEGRCTCATVFCIPGCWQIEEAVSVLRVGHSGRMTLHCAVQLAEERLALFHNRRSK